MSVTGARLDSPVEARACASLCTVEVVRHGGKRGAYEGYVTWTMMRAMPILSPPRRPHAAPAMAHDAGFTLLEVLVAFVIAALALGVLFEGAVEGIRSTRIADRTQEALSRAQSHLATIGHGTPLHPLTQEGEDGHGYHWRLRIAPLQSTLIGGSGNHGGAQTLSSQAPKAVLYSVQLTESWSDEASAGDHTRAVTLRTERLGQQAATGP